MDYQPLGSTGLTVSVAGLGCGGDSKLGMSTGSTVDEAVAIVSLALDLGVTFLDTAAAYGTEEIVGAAIKDRRDEVVLSTKVRPLPRGATAPITAEEMRDMVHASLRRLGTDHVDVLHLHGPPPETYSYCRAALVPEMLALRDEGKVDHLAISEPFGLDRTHSMLEAALDDEVWEVMMVGFNLLNQTAREHVIEPARDQGVGIEVMYAVRSALRSPETLRPVLEQLVADGYLDDWTHVEHALGFLLNPEHPSALVDAAYRFVRHQAGTSVVLTGTGNPDHLRSNLASIMGDPIPPEHHDALVTMLGKIGHLTGGAEDYGPTPQ
jgi:aryl-alcohol dehydrogenase-like predicted oxidoreductase